MRLDLGFDRGGVEIADGDDRHQVGSVPVDVELLQPIVIGVLDDLGFADGQPFGVARAFEQDGKLLVLYPLVGSQPEPPFFQDDAPFLVDLRRIEGDVVRPVFEDEQRPVNHRGIVGGNLQFVDGFIEARVGIHVRAEPHAERLHEGGDVLSGEVQRAVEAHVLDEVCEPPLIFVFEHRARVDGEPELGPGLGLLVGADVVAQAIGSVPTVISGSTGMVWLSGAFWTVVVTAGCCAVANLAATAIADARTIKRVRLSRVIETPKS